MKQINVVKLDTVKEDSDEYSRHILAATFLDALRNNGLNLEYLAGELARGNIQDLQISVVQRRVERTVRYVDLRFQSDRPIEGSDLREKARYEFSGLTALPEGEGDHELSSCELYDAICPHVRRVPFITRVDDNQIYIRTSDLAEPVQLTLL